MSRHASTRAFEQALAKYSLWGLSVFITGLTAWLLRESLIAWIINLRRFSPWVIRAIDRFSTLFLGLVWLGLVWFFEWRLDHLVHSDHRLARAIRLLLIQVIALGIVSLIYYVNVIR